MKTRNFYPGQVLRRLTGTPVSRLDATGRRVLNLGVLRARKNRLVVMVVNDQIAVHSREEVGRMMLADLKRDLAGMFQSAQVA